MGEEEVPLPLRKVVRIISKEMYKHCAHHSLSPLLAPSLSRPPLGCHYRGTGGSSAGGFLARTVPWSGV